MSKYLKKKKKGNGPKILLIVGSVLLILVLAAVAFLYSKLDLIQFDDEVDKDVYSETGVAGDSTEEGEDSEIVDMEGLETVETAPPIPESEIFKDENVVNILVIGTDERTKDFNPKSRSDCMILVSIDREKNTVKLVSLERGICAPILAGEHEGKYDILTHVFRYGGADLLMDTVEHLFKINVDHYVRFNFTAVKGVVDVSGGVEMNLTDTEAWALNEWPEGNLGVTLRKGNNKLNGKAALAFARLRSIDSDWQRVERQRKVILVVVDKLKGSSLITLNNLANEILPLIQTNMSKSQIAEWIVYAPNFFSAEFDQLTIPLKGTYGGMTVMSGGSFAVDHEINNPILKDFLYGDGELLEEFLNK